MSDESPAERREAAQTRRRWVTLAEVVAVAGVLIAALTLWNSWSERRDAEADRITARNGTESARARIDLTGTIEDDGRRILVKDAAHEIQDATFAFPTALGIATQTPVADPAIDAGWVQPAILKLTDGGPDARAGKLPVLVTIRYVDGDTTRSAGAVYDAIWHTEGRLLRGRTMRFEGFRLHQRGGSQALLDAIWQRANP